MIASAPFQEVLSSALTPITLISGVGMLILCMTNRYSHCMDRIRGLVKIRTQGLKALRVEPDIDREIRLIYRRARWLRFSPFAAIWLVLALLLIIAATVAFAFEIRLSLHALGLAVEHMPRGDALKKRLEEASK